MKNYNTKNNPDQDSHQSDASQATAELEKKDLNAGIFLASSQCRGTNEKYLYAFG